MQARITKRTVDAAKPGPRDSFLWDAEVKGFGLKVTPAGRKVYIVQYRPGGGRSAPVRRYTIGLHGAPWTPEQARHEAGKLLAKVKQGGDPAAIRQADRKAETVAELADRFMREHVEARRKGTTAKEYRLAPPESSAERLQTPISRQHLRWQTEAFKSFMQPLNCGRSGRQVPPEPIRHSCQRELDRPFERHVTSRNVHRALPDAATP
jgi:hypothetical protein